MPYQEPRVLGIFSSYLNEHKNRGSGKAIGEFQIQIVDVTSSDPGTAEFHDS